MPSVLVMTRSVPTNPISFNVFISSLNAAIVGYVFVAENPISILSSIADIVYSYCQLMQLLEIVHQHCLLSYICVLSLLSFAVSYCMSLKDYVSLITEI